MYSILSPSPPDTAELICSSWAVISTSHTILSLICPLCVHFSFFLPIFLIFFPFLLLLSRFPVFFSLSFHHIFSKAHMHLTLGGGVFAQKGLTYQQLASCGSRASSCTRVNVSQVDPHIRGTS